MLNYLLFALLFLALIFAPSHLSSSPSQKQQKEPAVVTLSLSQRPEEMWEPGKVRYKVQIEPHRDNIQFCYGYSSDNAKVYYRESCQQLNGIYSPRTMFFEYSGLGEGNYLAFVKVYRVPNRLAGEATDRFRILPPLGS